MAPYIAPLVTFLTTLFPSNSSIPIPTPTPSTSPVTSIVATTMVHTGTASSIHLPRSILEIASNSTVSTGGFSVAQPTQLPAIDPNMGMTTWYTGALQTFGIPTPSTGSIPKISSNSDSAMSTGGASVTQTTQLPPIDPNAGMTTWYTGPIQTFGIPTPSSLPATETSSNSTVSTGGASVTHPTQLPPIDPNAALMQEMDAGEWKCTPHCDIPLLMRQCTFHCRRDMRRDYLPSESIATSTSNSAPTLTLTAIPTSEGKKSSDPDRIPILIFLSGLFIILMGSLSIYLWPWKSQAQKAAERQRKADKEKERQRHQRRREREEQAKKERKEASRAKAVFVPEHLPDGFELRELQWRDRHFRPRFWSYQYMEARYVKDSSAQVPASATREAQHQGHIAAGTGENMTVPQPAVTRAGMRDYEASPPPEYGRW